MLKIDEIGNISWSNCLKFVKKKQKQIDNDTRQYVISEKKEFVEHEIQSKKRQMPI
jgi:hypothetical protein